MTAIKFAGKCIKDAVLKEKAKLKGTKICVDTDLTKKEREIQQTLRRLKWEERKKGHIIKAGVKKLIIGEDIYRYDEESVFMGGSMFRSDTIAAEKIEEEMETETRNRKLG